MNPLIEIVFGRSTSKFYTAACTLAQGIEGANFDQPTDSWNVSFSEAMAIEQFEKLSALWGWVKGWGSSQVKLQGTPVAPSEVEPILDVLRCAHFYDSAPIPDKYCAMGGDNLRQNGHWGCALLRTIDGGVGADRGIALRRGAMVGWWDFGAPSTPSNYVVDKKGLRAALGRECEAKRIHLCPHFGWTAADERIADLPETIDLNSDSNWSPVYRGVAGDTAGTMPDGIKPAELGGFRVQISTACDSDSSSSLPVVSERITPSVQFSDIGGIDAILQRIREVVELPISHPELFVRMGIRPHKGVLLYGPPGVGKTLIAKAIANEVGAHFISISASELASKWVGQSEENLRTVFSEATRLAPSIVFLDEIDSIGYSRDSFGSSRHDEKMLNQLLALMDGIEDLGQVCVVGSTNRLEVLDPALLRPGRFDYSIEIPLPNESGRLQILNIVTAAMPLDDIDLASVAHVTKGFSGAELAFAAREAGLNSIRRCVDLSEVIRGDTDAGDVTDIKVNDMDLVAALNLVTAGWISRGLSVSEKRGESES